MVARPPTLEPEGVGGAPLGGVRSLCNKGSYNPQTGLLLRPVPSSGIKKGSLPSLNNLILSKPVLGRKEELIAHREDMLWTDVIALAAEDAACHIDPDPLRLRDELDRMCRTDLETELTADTPVAIILDLPAECRGCCNRGDHPRLAGTDLLQELSDRFWKMAGRELVRRRCPEELGEDFTDHRECHLENPHNN